MSIVDSRSAAFASFFPETRTLAKTSNVLPQAGHDYMVPPRTEERTSGADAPSNLRLSLLGVPVSSEPRKIAARKKHQPIAFLICAD